MLVVEEHSNLTLANPEVIAVWNAKGNSRQNLYAADNDRGHGNNAIVGFKKNGYRFYNIEVGSGDNGTGTYQLKIRLNNICRIDDEGQPHYNWFGGPKGYNKLETPADTSTNLVCFVGTHDYNRVERAELSEFLGNSWDSAPDEDWFGADLQKGEQYTIRLRTKNSLSERFQATEVKIPGIHDADGNVTSATASSGAAGKKVFVTNWEAPAPESTTSPWEQRVPTGPASTGSASQRKSRTDEIPRQGARQRRDRRHQRNLSRAFYN